MQESCWVEDFFWIFLHLALFKRTSRRSECDVQSHSFSPCFISFLLWMRYGNFIQKRCGPSLLFYVGYSIFFSRLFRNIYAFFRTRALCYSSLLQFSALSSPASFPICWSEKERGEKEKNRRQEERKKKTFPLFSPTAQPESLFFFSPRRETENKSTLLYSTGR